MHIDRNQTSLVGKDRTLGIRLLGGFQLSLGDHTIGYAQLRLRKSRNLVKILALAPSHRLHRDQLLETLWSNLLPEAAAHNLHQVLYVTRRALNGEKQGADFLQFHDEVVSLGPSERIWIDVE